MPPAKTEVAVQLSECCAAEVALQHWFFCSADVILTKSCAAASEKLQCKIEKAALQKSGTFLLLSCGFQAPTFRHPRLGPAEMRDTRPYRAIFFEIVLQSFQGVAQVSLTCPSCEGAGYRTSTSHALQGGNAQKRGRGYRTQTHQKARNIAKQQA